MPKSAANPPAHTHPFLVLMVLNVTSLPPSRATSGERGRSDCAGVTQVEGGGGGADGHLRCIGRVERRWEGRTGQSSAGNRRCCPRGPSPGSLASCWSGA